MSNNDSHKNTLEDVLKDISKDINSDISKDVYSNIEIDIKNKKEIRRKKEKDYITKLLHVGTEICTNPETPEADKAFLSRQLIQVTLPHSSPGHIPVWTRQNNGLRLSIQQGYEDGKPIGYPFGSIPRLLIFWLTAEAIRTKSRRIELGNNLAAFMRQLGLNSEGGGKRGDPQRLKSQMRRLFRSTISFEYSQSENGMQGVSWIDMKVTSKGEYWWDFKCPNQSSMWDSWIMLGEDFFNALISYPVPLDMRALKALKSSALSLDLYSWLTWRAFVAYRTGNSQVITWKALNRQLGSNYSDLNNLITKCKAAIKKILVVYPKLDLEYISGGFAVLPSSRPAVPVQKLVEY